MNESEILKLPESPKLIRFLAELLQISINQRSR